MFNCMIRVSWHDEMMVIWWDIPDGLTASLPVWAMGTADMTFQADIPSWHSDIPLQVPWHLAQHIPGFSRAARIPNWHNHDILPSPTSLEPHTRNFTTVKSEILEVNQKNYFNGHKFCWLDFAGDVNLHDIFTTQLFTISLLPEVMINNAQG